MAQMLQEGWLARCRGCGYVCTAQEAEPGLRCPFCGLKGRPPPP